MDALASVVAARRGAWHWVVVAVASAALSGVVGLAAGHRPAANRVDPTYTLAGLSQVVAHDPERWMGRTVWVWGVAQRYCRRVDAFSCVTQVVLTDAQSPSWTDDLVLRPARDTAMLAVLRRLPLLGSLVPPPVLPWGVLARYHVQLQALPRTACAGPSSGRTGHRAPCRSRLHGIPQQRLLVLAVTYGDLCSSAGAPRPASHDRYVW